MAAKQDTSAKAKQNLTPEAQENQKKRAAAYTSAQRRLKDAHPEEFRNYYQDEAAARGVTLRERLSPAEKAERDMQRIVAEHPELAEKYGLTVEDGAA